MLTGASKEFNLNAKNLSSIDAYNVDYPVAYFSTWTEALKSQGVSLNITSLYDKSSDLFSVPNMLDSYHVVGEGTSALGYIQEFLLRNTREYAMDVRAICRTQDPSQVFNFELLLNNYNFNASSLESITLKHLSNSMAHEMQRVTSLKFDLDLMIDVFPDFDIDIASFDIGLSNEEVTLYQTLSTPDFKLYYPEPFIASPSFVHEELWFIHILHYQHWLWFMFISLIMLYFITFINVVRWCSMRVRPRRETRGVSRSKCADLITATVPVSWAMSIIVSESVDAADYYDGFGTGEIVVGIRAYQWGWEYFYPKGIDLNYNVSPSFSSVVGNSLKYSTSESKTATSNALWKHYQAKSASRTTSTPAHILLSANSNDKVLNFMNFKDLGLNTAQNQSAFKKIQSFSKTNPQALFTNPSDFGLRYDKLASLYLSESDSSNVSTYGTYRQHASSSMSATLNNRNTLLDSKAFDKFTSYNMNETLSSPQSKPSSSLTTVPTRVASSLTADSLRAQTVLGDADASGHNPQLSKFLLFPKTTGQTFSESDQKIKSNSAKYALADKWLDAELVDRANISDRFTKDSLPSFTQGNDILSKLTNAELNYKFKNLKSSNLQFLSTEKNARALGKVGLGKTLVQFDDMSNSFNTLANNLSKKTSATTQLSLFKAAEANFATDNFKSRVVSASKTLSPNHPPVHATNPVISPYTFDKFVEGKPTESPLMLRSKEEVAPTFLFSSYWLTHWAHTNPTHRFNLLQSKSSKLSSSYFPLIIDYAEYDFKNWQAIEQVEDVFWESAYSSFAHEDYIDSKEGSPNVNYFSRQEEFFISDNRIFTHLTPITYVPFGNFPVALKEVGSFVFPEALKSLNPQALVVLSSNTLPTKENWTLSFKAVFSPDLEKEEGYKGFNWKPFIRDKSLSKRRISAEIFSEDAPTRSANLPLNSYEPFLAEVTVDSFEDVYENMKNVSSSYTSFHKNINLVSLNAITPLSYAQILDNFRPDFEEKTTHVDASSDPKDFDLSVEANPQLTLNNDIRFSNPVKVRASAKSAIVTFNAIQKVYKSRFDEGRSNVRPADFANSYSSHPFVTSPRSNYEGMLGKNKESFFAVNNYKLALKSGFSDTFALWGSLNTYFADLPFLVSMKSDPSRYLWFDWQSNWSSIELQPSSVARFSLLGVPYSTKHFEYETNAGTAINDSETYLIKLGRARKNYLSNWAYTPYFYAKLSNWYKKDLTSLYFFRPLHDLKELRFMFTHAKWAWHQTQYFGNTHTLSTPSFSGVNTFARSSWRPTTGVQSYYYNSTILVDILSKREFLYRQYFLREGITMNMPKYLLAAPTNPLLKEVKKAYPLVDPASFTSEASREFLYQNANFLKFNIIKDFLEVTNSKLANSTVNLSSITNYLFFYLFGTAKNEKLGRNLDLYKSQYRPMRKGVTNMIRLHATGAVAMPIEIRMHILASSKDVIHSWAIPSAGIKIDCVPGYSSHRVTIFLVSGIFWGQCMEICGRFHHWMPIIVYFMKRDLFFLWCTHFMHYSEPDKAFNMCDRQLMDHVRLVSFDKTTWVHELNNII